MPKFKDFEPVARSGSWLNLKQGENKVRIISEYQEYGSHYDKEKGSFACIGKNNGCEFCQQFDNFRTELSQLKENAGDTPSEEDKSQIKELEKNINYYRPRIQYLVWVIDRVDGEVKILRYGYTVQLKLGELSKNDDYKFEEIPDYDVTIVKKGSGLGTEYDVIPARNSLALTEEEKIKISETVKNLEEVIKRMKEKAMPVVNIDEQEAPEISDEEAAETDGKKIPF